MKNLKNSAAAYLLLLMGAIISFVANSKSPIINEALRKKYPYSMLTPDYGIITEFDLAKDAKKYNLTPYNPLDVSTVSYWQCVPPWSVTNKYDTWRDSDPLGAVTSIITLCFIDTVVKSKNDWHIYVHRRAHPVEYCRDFVKNWKKITKNEPSVCLGGEATSIEKKTEKGVTHTEHLWVWNKFKTRKGCYSYFGDCGP